MIDSERLIPTPRRAARYVELSTSKAIQTALWQARETGDPSLVIGRSGVGKSAAIAEILADGQALGCTMTAAYHDRTGIYRMLLEVYGIHAPRRGTTKELSERVYGEIRGRYEDIEPLIIDEYQGIELTALRELLKVQDALGMALVLVGNGETIAERRKTEQQEAMEQIINRYGLTVRIDGLLDSDFEALADEWMVEPTPHTRAAVQAYGRRFSLHQLTMLLRQARELAAIGPTRFEHLQTVVALANPDRLTVFSPPVTKLSHRRAQAQNDDKNQP